MERDRDPPETPDAATRESDPADERIQQRALAGAVGAEQCHDLSPAQLEIDAVDDQAPVATHARSLAREQQLTDAGRHQLRGRNRHRIPPPRSCSRLRPPSRTTISATSTIPIASASAKLAASTSYSAALASVWS